MANQRFKMFSPERISIILLVAALCIWAAATTCRRFPAEVAADTRDSAMADSLSIQNPDTTLILSGSNPSTKNKSGNKKNSRKGNPKKKVNHRDPLNEPVPSF